MSYTDPNGESVVDFLANYTFLKPAFQLADVISTYNNEGSGEAWNLAGKYIAQASIEAGVALATAGVASVVSNAVASGAISQLGGAAIQAGAHGVINGSASALQGGSFGRGFAIGALSSASGSALVKQSPLIQFGGSVVTGGITSKIAGGTFAEGAITAGIISGANHLGHYISENRRKVNLSASPDEVLKGLINQFDYVFEGPFLRQPNDGRSTNYYNINDLVENPPGGANKGSFTQVLTSSELYTKKGVKFRWAISPADYSKTKNYSLGYLYDLQTDAGSSIGAMHLLGRDGHSVLTLTIYGKSNYVPIFNKIYKGYRIFD